MNIGFKHFFVALAAIGFAVFGAKAETSTLQLGGFQQVKVVGNLNVDCVYNPDSVGMVIINAPNRAQISWVEASSNGTLLKLKLQLPDEMRTGKQEIPLNLPSVTVYTKYVTKVENEGDSTLRVLTATDVPKFEARLMGNGRLSVRGVNTEKLTASLFTGSGTLAIDGKADKATYRLTGVGTIEADGVECREATVQLTGTGAVGVYATEKLKISGSGSGTVYFRGTPDVNRKVSVGIKLQPIDDINSAK